MATANDPDRIYEITGPWDFYWDELLEPDKIGPKAGSSVLASVSWSKQGFEKFGKATYRIKVSAEAFEQPALLIPKINSASKVWVNGKLIAQKGQLDKDQYENFILEELVTLDRAASYEIVIQVANYDIARAGLNEAPVFGEFRQLYNYKNSRESLLLFWTGCIFLMAIFHLFMYVTSRPFMPYFYLGIICLLLVVKILVYEDHFGYYFLKDSGLLNAWLQLHLYHFSASMFAGVGLLYIQSIYPPLKFQEIGKYLFISFGVLGLFFLIAPTSSFGPAIFLAKILALFGFTYAGFCGVLGLKERRNWLQIFALGILLISGVLDTLWSFSSMDWVILPFAIPLFLVAQFIYLAQEFSVAFRRAEKMNRTLDETVRERTRKIIAQNEELEAQATKLAKLDAAKTKFYENVNHDLRTPLMLIEGYLSQIGDDKDNYLTTKSEGFFKKLQRNLALIRSLNDQMNDLSLVEKNKLKLQFEQVNLAEFVREIVDLFQPKAQTEGKELKFKGNVGDTIQAHVDKQQLSRVLFNILNNALQYTPEEGKIIVILQGHKLNDGFTICIYNTGKAISQEVLPHLFDRFYRGQEEGLRSNVKGMGIGLELAKEITELHGGHIMADSLNNYGTCFFISMPYNLDIEVDPDDIKIEGNVYEKNVPQAIPKKDTQTIKVDSKKANVLIVDDNQEIRDYVKEILSDDYAIDEAENGKVALDKIDTGYYDLVISDLMMPWIDGFELIKRMNEERYKDIPILIVSARTSESDKLKVLDDGALDFLTKPFNPKELSQRVANIMKYKNSWNAYDDLNHKHKTQIEKDLLGKLQNMVHEHIDDPKLSVAMIADELCMAERSAYRMIKTLTDKTPLEYIKSLRYEYAYDLLAKRKVNTASEAARLIGVSNSTYFSTQFKKRFNVSPDGLLKQDGAHG
ncbi:MAG: response regulator [Cytophagales bacterium]|nr:response regulator [Cytophagales bacterium]